MKPSRERRVIGSVCALRWIAEEARLYRRGRSDFKHSTICAAFAG